MPRGNNNGQSVSSKESLGRSGEVWKFNCGFTIIGRDIGGLLLQPTAQGRNPDTGVYLFTLLQSLGGQSHCR